jgi:hypothetical protein
MRVEKKLEGKGDLKVRDHLIKLASESPEEEFDLDLIQTLSQYEEWKKNNQGKTYDDFLREMGLIRKKYNSGGDVEDYSDLIDAYERGIDVMEGETLTQYIRRIKASEKNLLE